ncbi:MAG: hypothetical protein A2355_09215 [Spirochaetes bacterium RIFOXYB1_FULL_32_8]|nr:MAG: hypothetical protein A2Y30_16420 [Spirochaetes bacterium GWE1_32_154]OHD48559.1 MAG: hypothetical protein A2Y29_14395 [Spirochaetes bacterium GWE2_31_10]OHD78447.1 MAG: hypothetical protein A2355_09215 [Spirochaetes bacterium RIFOXYB1_FULL_32_8]HBD93305.1 hypothetical protein [Spirochaetia bacterium]HBI36637.1 hypothetical protein [Spirochaetia bacterium]
MSDSLSRIEKIFVLTFLKNNKVTIEIKTPKSITHAIITDLNNNEILIELDTLPLDIKEYKLPCEVFFYFQDNYHAFNSSFIKYQGKTAVIKNPEGVAKNLKRKHDRVVVDGQYKVNLFLEGPIIPLDYPKTSIYYNPERPPINADFTDIKITDILAKFNKKMESFVTTNKIQMMRNYTAKNFIEKLAIDTGKIVFIPNTATELNIKTGDDIPINICRKNDWIDFEKKLNNTQDTYINKALSTYMVELKEKGVFSIAVVPVIYREYVVALITLVNDYKKAKLVDYSILKYTEQFSKIMTYSLKHGGYFKAEIGNKIEHETKMFDISPGGLSILSDGPLLEEKLTIDDNIEMELNFENKKISVLSKYVRKQEKLLNLIYGFMFINISIEDYSFIENRFIKK